MKTVSATLGIAALLAFVHSPAPAGPAYPSAHHDVAAAPPPQRNSVRAAAGTLTFESTTATLTEPMKKQLSDLAGQMGINPRMRVVITANGGGGRRKSSAKAREGADAVIAYMSEVYGIDKSRFDTRTSRSGDGHSVSYRPAEEKE